MMDINSLNSLNGYKDKIIAKILANELPPKEEKCVCKNISKVKVETFYNELTYEDVTLNFVKEYTVLCGPEKEPELYYRLSTFIKEYQTNTHFKSVSQIKEYVILIHEFLNNPDSLEHSLEYSLERSSTVMDLKPKSIVDTKPKDDYEKELDKLRKSEKVKNAKSICKPKRLKAPKLSNEDSVGVSARIPIKLYEKVSEYCDSNNLSKSKFFIELIEEKFAENVELDKSVTEFVPEQVSTESEPELESEPITESKSETKPKSHREKQIEPNSVFYNGIGMKDKLGAGAELVDDTEFRKLFREHYHIDIGEPSLLNSDERNLMILVGRLTYKMRYSQIKFVTGIRSKLLYKFGYLLSLCKSNPAKIKKILQGCPVLTFDEVQAAYLALEPDIKRFKCIENYVQSRK